MPLFVGQKAIKEPCSVSDLCEQLKTLPSPKIKKHAPPGSSKTAIAVHEGESFLITAEHATFDYLAVLSLSTCLAVFMRQPCGAACLIHFCEVFFCDWGKILHDFDKNRPIEMTLIGAVAYMGNQKSEANLYAFLQDLLKCPYLSSYTFCLTSQMLLNNFVATVSVASLASFQNFNTLLPGVQFPKFPHLLFSKTGDIYRANDLKEMLIPTLNTPTARLVRAQEVLNRFFLLKYASHEKYSRFVLLHLCDPEQSFSADIAAHLCPHAITVTFVLMLQKKNLLKAYLHCVQRKNFLDASSCVAEQSKKEWELFVKSIIAFSKTRLPTLRSEVASAPGAPFSLEAQSFIRDYAQTVNPLIDRLDLSVVRP